MFSVFCPSDIFILHLFCLVYIACPVYSACVLIIQNVLLSVLKFLFIVFS